MVIEMQIKSKPFKQVDRDYIITSKELRKALDLKGEIISINLWKGRSPNEEEEGKSPEKDEWVITTKDIKKLKNKC